MTSQDTFWSRVQKTETCWIWGGYRDRYGYGKFCISHTPLSAHRLAYEWVVGEIPAGLTIDHLCRNRACVNPDHLEPVTNRVNVLRGDAPTAINARKTHCKRGHRLEARRNKKGSRYCLECKRLYYRESMRRKRAGL